MRRNLRETLLGFVRGFHVSVCKLVVGIGEGVPCAIVNCGSVSQTKVIKRY
jgi:hypothetical protein